MVSLGQIYENKGGLRFAVTESFYHGTSDTLFYRTCALGVWPEAKRAALEHQVSTAEDFDRAIAEKGLKVVRQNP